MTDQLCEGSSKPHICIICGEPSGDALGAKLIEALKKLHTGEIEFSGIGGEHMEALGFDSLYPMADIAVMGPRAIVASLPLLVKRVYQCVDHVINHNPDVFVIIDSPEFTHQIAKRVRKRNSKIPIVNYVSPTVWAWRPGRAKKMRPYVDEVLGLLPFEPEAHKRLNGPLCSYVGHPLIEKLEQMKSADDQIFRNILNIQPDEKIVALLPGSRTSEVFHLLEPFGVVVERLSLSLAKQDQQVKFIIPCVPTVEKKIEDAIKEWPVKPLLIRGEQDKYALFKTADAALTASGTATLELALAGVPMVVAYKVDKIMVLLRFLLKTRSVVLANLILDENIFPELLQEECTPERLIAALRPLLTPGSPELDKQMAALNIIAKKMSLPDALPSEAAASRVLEHI